MAGMGVACGDLDGDCRTDLAVANFYGESMSFYHNLGQMTFADHTARIGLQVPTRTSLGFGTAFLDANNDGYLDLAVTNGHVNDFLPEIPFEMPSQLFLGGPSGRLTDVSDRAGAPWQVPRIGRGLAVGDLDNDGRLDLMILGQNQPLAYFHNQSAAGHWLTLRLEGTVSNRDAVGATGDRRGRRPAAAARSVRRGQLPIGVRLAAAFRPRFRRQGLTASRFAGRLARSIGSMTFPPTRAI